MSLFIKLTNNRPDLKGAVMHFNVDHIICFYDMETPEGMKTFIYGGSPPDLWDIEESSIIVEKRILDARISEKEI